MKLQVTNGMQISDGAAVQLFHDSCGADPPSQLHPTLFPCEHPIWSPFGRACLPGRICCPSRKLTGSLGAELHGLHASLSHYRPLSHHRQPAKLRKDHPLCSSIPLMTRQSETRHRAEAAVAGGGEGGHPGVGHGGREGWAWGRTQAHAGAHQVPGLPALHPGLQGAAAGGIARADSPGIEY